MIPHKQLSLADIFTDCQNKFDHDKYAFLEILAQAIHLDDIVPVSFILHFHAATGRKRVHQLYPMPPQTLPSSRCTSMGISAMPINLAW